MSYATEHASAYADIAAAGATITFSRVTPGAFNFATRTTTDAYTVSVSGVAMQVKGDPTRYASLGLKQSASPTLLFCPTTYGELPELDALGTWDGVTVTVRDVSPVAPDGTAIVARLIVASGGRSHLSEPVASESSNATASETDETTA